MPRAKVKVSRGVQPAPVRAARKSAAPKANQATDAPAAEQAQAQEDQPSDGLAHTLEQRRALNGSGRENPARRAGDALRQFCNERGLARSELASMSDERMREQVKFIVRRQYEAAHAE